MKLKTFILVTLLLLTWRALAYAQDGEDLEPQTLILSDDQSEYPLGLYLELLEDPSGELTIEDITSPEYDSRFTPSQVEVPNYGFTESAYWVRLRLRNDSPAIEEWLLEVTFANMHFVDLYFPLADGSGYAEKQSGALRPPEIRDINHPHVTFNLTVPSQDEQTLYMRFENGASMTLPLTIWTQAAFMKASLRSHFLQIALFGLLVGMLAFNLFLLISLREASYLYLVLLIVGILVLEGTYSGYLEAYVIPDLYYLKPQYQGLSHALWMIAMVMFADTFLGMKQLNPRFHWLLIVISGIWALLGLSALFTDYYNIAILMAPLNLVSMAALVVAGIIAWRRYGFRYVWMYLFAWLGLIIGMFVVSMVRLGLIASTPIAENLYRFGYAWLVVFWSLALADRINLLKADAESASRELQESERRLSQTLEAMPVGVVVYGEDERPTYMNKRTVDILTNPTREMGPDLSAGRTLAEAMDYFSFRITGSDETYPLDEMPIHRALRGEPASVDDVEADLVDKRVPLEIWASPVFDSADNVESAVVAFQDISERKRHEAELEQYRTHLEQLVLERTEELNAINETLTSEVAERAILEGLLHKRIQWMSIIALTRQRIKGTADLPTTYEQLSKEIQQLLDVGSLFLIRWQDGGEQAEFLCQPMIQGPGSNPEYIRTSFEVDTTLRQNLEPDEIVILSKDEVNAMEEPIRVCFAGSGMETLLIVPMVDGERVVGVLGLALSLPRQELSPAQRELIIKMTLDLVNLAQEARFLDQTRALVASEERNRLARDLHDSVTQVLFSASLVAEVLPQIWQRNPERAMESLDELRRLTRGALAEMRTMLLELRPAAVVKSPLPELLAQLTEASTSRTQLPFRLFIEQTPPLPKDVHAAFYRIAQESLNNVTKHARANEVTLSLRTIPLTPQQTAESMVDVQLEIEDDGLGFSPDDEQIEHLGLGIMRERAADIEADLDISSKIGRGTRVKLDWCGLVNDIENGS